MGACVPFLFFKSLVTYLIKADEGNEKTLIPLSVLT